ncbi:MAG: hypothetical protein PHW04_10590 [Candidatus Wallbacteria bacterium]|nr:hypothetical protein [Candidatus Wallbacteria bacterium]
MFKKILISCSLLFSISSFASLPDENVRAINETIRSLNDINAPLEKSLKDFDKLIFEDAFDSTQAAVICATGDQANCKAAELKTLVKIISNAFDNGFMNSEARELCNNIDVTTSTLKNVLDIIQGDDCTTAENLSHARDLYKTWRKLATQVIFDCRDYSKGVELAIAAENREKTAVAVNKAPDTSSESKTEQSHQTVAIVKPEIQVEAAKSDSQAVIAENPSKPEITVSAKPTAENINHEALSPDGILKQTEKFNASAVEKSKGTEEFNNLLGE